MTRLLLCFSVLLASFTSVEGGEYYTAFSDQTLLHQVCNDQIENDQSTEDADSIPKVQSTLFPQLVSTHYGSDYALGLRFLFLRSSLIRAPPFS